MNKLGLVKDEEGRRTSGVLQFYDELPEHIIPLQKSIPPYMKFLDGYGYIGVLLCDTQKDRVQCHFCGRWYKALGQHIGKKHKLTATGYKDKVGLFRKEALMSLRTKLKFEEAAKDKDNYHQSQQNLDLSPKIPINDFMKNLKKNSSKEQWKNKYGTCNAQLKFRLENAIQKYGRLPMWKEEPNLIMCLKRRWGSYQKGLEFYKLK